MLCHLNSVHARDGVSTKTCHQHNVRTTTTTPTTIKAFRFSSVAFLCDLFVETLNGCHGKPW